MPLKCSLGDTYDLSPFTIKPDAITGQYFSWNHGLDPIISFIASVLESHKIKFLKITLSILSFKHYFVQSETYRLTGPNEGLLLFSFYKNGYKIVFEENRDKDKITSSVTLLLNIKPET